MTSLLLLALGTFTKVALALESFGRFIASQTISHSFEVWECGLLCHVKLVELDVMWECEMKI